MSKTESIDLSVKLEKLAEEVKKVVRRQDEIQKSVDLLFADREILEDMQGSIAHLKEIIVQNQQHQDKARDSVEADIKVVAETVKDISNNTVIVKSKNKGLLNNLTKLFKREVSK